MSPGHSGRTDAANVAVARGTLDTPRAARRRAMVLPVMLVILLLLGLLAAGFVFQAQAEYTASKLMSQRLQCRLAAEAGVQRVMLMLRTERDNPSAWYNNPEMFDQALLWKPNATIEEIGIPSPRDDKDQERKYGYRFSIVADDPLDDETEIRFGITDEASKLNINVATEEQLLTLINQILPPEPEVTAEELVHALIDWRDADDEAQEFGAESDYYQQLPVPYACKNAPFDTPEELLMVKGFNGRILYGEDYNQNGLLEPSEDDGDAVFPRDDADGILNRGLLPYITVRSKEYNNSCNNKPRIYLFQEKSQLEGELEEAFDDPEIVEFILGAAKSRGTMKINSLADFLTSKIIDDREVRSPIEGDAVNILFDRCTLDPPDEYYREGRINILTAPSQVLRCITGVTEDMISRIVEKRAELTADAKTTTAWLVTQKVLTAAEYAAIRRMITCSSRQFTVESIGFSDHLRVYCRLQAVIEMNGPLSQVVYYRDLTRLGLAFPIRGEEGDRYLVRQTD